jgi:hypothetical protein
LGRRVAVILCAALAAGAGLGSGAPPAFADAGDFLPTPWQNGSYLDLFGSYESDDITRVASPYGWDDTFLREKVTLFSDGFVYHPRFMQYHLSVGGALKQERYDTTFIDSPGWTHSTGVEYDTRLYFLPEHPYNLELFALRYEPLYKQQASTQHNSVETSYGASLQYRRKPWLAHARYSVDTIDQDLYSTTIDRLGLDGEYFKRYVNGNQLTFNAAYNPSTSTTSEGLDADTNQYLFGNMIDLRSVRLNSTVSRNDHTQESDFSGRFTNDQFQWWELLNVYFPYNLRSEVSYRRNENESTIPDVVTGMETDLTDDSDELQFELIHRLYDSLDSSYIYLDTSRSSSGGDTDARFQAVNFNYTKKIPDENRLNLGMNLGEGDTQSLGRTDIVSEPHPAVAVPGFFVLAQQNVDPASIVVFSRSPVAPFPLVQLIEGVHYFLTPINNTYEVDLFGMPTPPFIVPSPPGGYDFFASYSLTGGDYDLRTRTRAFTSSVELFNTMLTPYYSYVAVRSDVLSGVFPGIPFDSTTNTAGVRYQRGPWRARGEYQDLEWEVSPYRAFRGDVQYVGDLSPTTNLYGTAAYIHRYFPDGSSPAAPDPYSDRTLSASGSLRKLIPDRGLTLSVGASVSQTQGLVDTSGWSLNSSLNWRIGKLDVSAGANVYGSDTRGTTTVESDRVHQYYYVTVRRVLF